MMSNKIKKAKKILGRPMDWAFRRINFDYDAATYALRDVPAQKLLNWVHSEWDSLKRPISPRSMPRFLEIEPINICNLHCPGCTAGRGDMERRQGAMTLPEFQRVVDQLSDHAGLLILYERGEPFLNKELCPMIEYATKKGMRVVVSTNGHFLEAPEAAERVVRSGLDHLMISLDGTSQESYGSYRRGGDLQKVVSGVRAVLKARDRAGLEFPRVDLRFIPMRRNENEIPLVKKLAAELGVDMLSFKTYNPAQGPEGTVEEFLPLNEKYRRFSYGPDGLPTRNERNDCTKPWNTLSVRWDLSVVPCNCDYQDDFVLGDLKKQSVEDVWHGAGYARFRKSFLDDWTAHPLCSGCTYAFMKPGCFTGEMLRKKDLLKGYAC
jgi:radical SAM protein with 4Fe4S-binding SPASM domain